MLTPPQLTEALCDALKSSGRCTRFCAAGLSAGTNCYVAHHNGVGRGDSDLQTVYSADALTLTQPAFTGRLVQWLTGLHDGERIDLNGPGGSA